MWVHIVLRKCIFFTWVWNKTRAPRELGDMACLSLCHSTELIGKMESALTLSASVIELQKLRHFAEAHSHSWASSGLPAIMGTGAQALMVFPPGESLECLHRVSDQVLGHACSWVRALQRFNETESVSHSVASNSLWTHGLLPTRLLCPWDSPGKNTGVGCHFLLQGIFPTQGLDLGLPHHRQILYCLSHQRMYNGEPVGIVCWAPLYPLVHTREAAPCPVAEWQPCTVLCPALASHSQAIAGAGTDVEQSEPAGPTLITGADIWPHGKNLGERAERGHTLVLWLIFPFSQFLSHAFSSPSSLPLLQSLSQSQKEWNHAISRSPCLMETFFH